MGVESWELRVGIGEYRVQIYIADVFGSWETKPSQLSTLNPDSDVRRVGVRRMAGHDQLQIQVVGETQDGGT